MLARPRLPPQAPAQRLEAPQADVIADGRSRAEAMAVFHRVEKQMAATVMEKQLIAGLRLAPSQTPPRFCLSLADPFVSERRRVRTMAAGTRDELKDGKETCVICVGPLTALAEPGATQANALRGGVCMGKLRSELARSRTFTTAQYESPTPALRY